MEIKKRKESELDYNKCSSSERLNLLLASRLYNNNVWIKSCLTSLPLTKAEETFKLFYLFIDSVCFSNIPSDGMLCASVDRSCTQSVSENLFSFLWKPVMCLVIIRDFLWRHTTGKQCILDRLEVGGSIKILIILVVLILVLDRYLVSVLKAQYEPTNLC